MKIFLSLIIILLSSCGKNHSNSNQYLDDSKSDSIIAKSNKTILVSDTVNEISDSITTTKVDGVVKEIRYLTKYVERLKIERVNLTKELTVSKQNVRIDTVFIETKKSFWGKPKTTINSKTETQTNQVIDSILTQTTDTIN
jgi:hypothetical protein